LPTSIPAVKAVAIPDAIVSPLHMVRTRGQVRPGDRLAIIGAGGGLGLHMIQIARLYGAKVAGLEITEEKFAIIEELGAKPVDSTSIDNLDPEALWDGERPSIVIDLVGQQETLAWGLRALAPGGRMVLLTTFRDVDFAIDPREIVVRRLSILGSRYVSKAEIVEAAELVEAGHVRPIVTQVVSPEDVKEVHHALQRGTLIGRGALQWID
jgi:propanol-preferring alcohol dehydrogenase